jgi:hypothetical protein
MKKQRGRKSINLLAINVDGMPPRLSAPAGLSKAERKLFDFLVGASPPHHFTDTDQPLLLSYVQTCVMAHSAKSPAKLSIFERLVRLQAMLATKLRLSPQTRLDPKTLARAAANFDPNAQRPWETKNA